MNSKPKLKPEKLKKTPKASVKPRLTKAQREKEIERLRRLLKSGGRFTVQEIASIRGRIGGLSGAEHPSRREGGLKGSAIRWHKETIQPK